MIHHKCKNATLLLLVGLLASITSIAQTAPEIGKNYYIAAQTWDGSKYVERFLYLSGNYVYQTTDIQGASVWSALKPSNGSGIALRCNNKYLMRGGISSASWGSIISPATMTISDPPAGSMTLKSTVTNYAYYIIAPNAGTGFTAVNAAAEASYQPKTSLYTPYFRFYEAGTPLLAVTECGADGSAMAVGAEYLLIPQGKASVAGNVWPLQPGRLAIDASSYNHLFYTFMGFKVGASEALVDEVDTDGLSANTTVKAIFTTNSLEGEVFTFISSAPEWYANQRVYKAIYLDAADNMLKWKTYDPADDAFYFRAHGGFDSLAFESVALPGLYMTGATTAVSEEGATVQLQPLGAGDYSIVAGGQSLYAYGHNNGRAVSGTLTATSGTSGSVAAWWIQSANDKDAEAARYAAALARQADMAAETERQAARQQLLDAIRGVTVGDNMGNVPVDAYDLAVSTYENNTLSAADYLNARTLLYSSCRVPGLGTKWRIINNGNSGQIISVGINNGLIRTGQRASLYQMWEVAAADPENPTRLAFRNLGSGTYMHCGTTSSATPTVTTENPVYVNLNAITPGVFSIEVLGRADQYIYFATSPYGTAIIVNTAGAWRFAEVPETELDQLSQAEDSRRQTRQALLDLINDVKRLSSASGAIGYYATLEGAVATAQTVYNDPTRLTTEYQAGITALQTAVRDARTNQPEADALYIICDHNGRIAMQHKGDKAVLTDYDDTDLDHFWRLAAVAAGSDELLPWTQRYTLTSIEGDNTVLDLTATVLGDDEYLISIGGDAEWNSANASTPLSIHKAGVGTHHGYLDDGEVYRIRNVATGKVLTRSETWTARVSVEAPDNTYSDLNQLWRVEMQPGADRYQLRNLESDRLIEEQLKPGAQLVAAFTPGTWHLQAASQAGQYRLLTTMAPVTQLAIGCDGDRAVAVSQGTDADTWIFEKATGAPKETVSRQVYKIVNRYETERTPGITDCLYTNDRWVSHTYANKSFADGIYSKWILIERDSVAADGTPALDAVGRPIKLVALQSAYCSKYVVFGTNFTMGLSPYYFQMVEYTDPNTGGVYTMFKDPAADRYFTPRTGRDEMLWYTVATDKYPHWTLQPVEGETMTPDDMLDRSDSMKGFCKPQDGDVVRIFTSNETTCLDDYYKQNILQHKEYNEKRYAQLWRLHHDHVTGLYKIENIYTGNYIANSPSASSTVTTTADPSKAGEFAIARNKRISSSRQYNILDANLGLALNSAGTNINNSNPAAADMVTTTEFRFRPAGGTEEDYAAMRRKYLENKDLLGNVDKYDAILSTLFADKACTTLRPDVTPEQIDEAVDNLPDVLAEMVMKISADAWPLGASGTNWEKMFRIREYPVVSNSAFSGVIRCAYNFSTMNEPTGILARPGDVVAVMVDDEPKKGSALRLEMVEGLSRSGSQVNLKQGLNLVQISEECNLFVYYMVTSTADNPAYYLSNFPDIRIHIEGGEVYGCINRVHGPGKTVEEADDLWVRMQRDGLIKNGPMAQVVGESIMLNFNSWDMLQGCPEKVGEVIDIWDYWIKIQQWIMGLRDHDGNIINDYIPNLKERWNNRWLAYERTGGYMNANGGGAQYNTSTIQGIVNFNSLKQGGGAWGPVHEHGHDHQTLINMCGMTEVSNNLFSNVCTREFGAVVSRGSSLPDAGSVYARGGNWFDNNIWTMTQMYFKLYLYYHVAGHKPTFYPEVFARLRSNPLLHNASVAVPADRDYLQFALVCSEVAGEDLSEFFEAYGMLRPLTPEYSIAGESAYEDFKGYNCRIVGDYSTYHVYTTDEMIRQAREAMAACGPRNGNIMFIDDRVRREPAGHPWAEPGQMRAERSDGGKIGAYGDVGMWDDFTAAGQDRYAQGYTLTKEWSAKGVTLHVSGEGAVGYKIYGPSGELVYFSAFNDILLPAAILENYDLADLSVAVAQADGTSVELAAEGDQLYNITTYRGGSAEGVTIPSAGRLEPELKGNDVCVVEPVDGVDAVGYNYRDSRNVIMRNDAGSHTMALLDVADMTPLYLPAQVHAATTTYGRANTAGWNSVCLPVALTEDDFGPGCKIYTVMCVNDADGTYSLTLRRKYAVEAAEPCFVWCPDEVDSWSVIVDDSFASTDVNPAWGEEGDVRINGSFVEGAIGEGKYKLNADGTAFGRTSIGGKAYPFRSYVEVASGSPQKMRLRIYDDSLSGAGDGCLDLPMLPGKVYDLGGRMLPAPPKGKPYILDGKVRYDM